VLVCSVDSLPVEPGTLDFAYSLGVLHHVPDTAAAVRSCAAALRPGAPLLLYLYYSFENRPAWYRALWHVSEMFRKSICRTPFAVRNLLAEVFAALVYWPLSRVSRGAGRFGWNVSNWPLSAYRQASFYSLRTDARDRLGTRLEQRFSRAAVIEMMEAAGLVDIVVSDEVPFWTAIGYRPTT
jgi:SAM-dependent methyltransferase